MESVLKLKNLRVSDFNFFSFVLPGLESDITGELQFRKGRGRFFSKGEFELINSNSKGRKLLDSKLKIDSKNDVLIAEGSLLGKSLMFESKIDFKRSKEKKSFFKGKINVLEIKDILSIISPHNFYDESLSGEIIGDFSAQFNLFKPLNLSSDLKVQEFSLSKEGKSISINQDDSRVIISDGRIVKWNLKIGKEEFFHSIGKGVLNGNFKIENIFKFSSSWAEVLSPRIKVESGVIEGRYVIKSKKGDFKRDLDFKGRNINFSIDDIPGRFEGLNAYLLGENEDFLIQKFKLNYGKGDVSLGGTVKLGIPYPDVDIKYKISNSNIFFLDNSNVIVSGNGSVSGNKLPYLVKGGHLVLGGSILTHYQV